MHKRPFAQHHGYSIVEANMGYLREIQEAEALAAMHSAQVSGTKTGPVRDDIAHALTSNRLAETDDFGNLRITERGLHHLQQFNLKRHPHRHIKPE